MLRNNNSIEKEYAVLQEKYTNLIDKYEELEYKNSEDSKQLRIEITNLKTTLQKLTVESTEEIARLRK
jgi:hypothetical protein